MSPENYSVAEQLRDGAWLTIRALRPSDREEMIAAVSRSSDETLYRRFFAPKRNFSESELDFFLNVDFDTHVALVAVLPEGGKDTVVGGARYVVARPGCAELAFVIDDAHQRRGIGGHLMRHLIAIARDAGLKELIADVLPGNLPMLKVFERCGLAMTTRHDRGVVRLTLAVQTH